jgi:hypothetical protein
MYVTIKETGRQDATLSIAITIMEIWETVCVQRYAIAHMRG